MFKTRQKVVQIITGGGGKTAHISAIKHVCRDHVRLFDGVHLRYDLESGQELDRCKPGFHSEIVPLVEEEGAPMRDELVKWSPYDVPTADALIEYLNSLLSIDPFAIDGLIEARVSCNPYMVEHPTVQTAEGADGETIVGILGVLNGFCGVITDGPAKGRGPITAVYDDDRCGIVRFVRTESLFA